MHLASNLKFLRKRKRLTQDDVSKLLEIKRSTLNGYEQNISRPSIEGLILLSDFFGFSIDSLIRINLEALSESVLSQMEKGPDPFIRGTKLRILSTTVDTKNQENIEMVPEKAKAGYATGFADPEFITDLPVYQLPIVSSNKKFRSFQISGDSMLPIPEGSWITGEFVQDWNLIKSGTACIVLTLNDGIVFKILETRPEEAGVFKAISLNPIYKPFNIRFADIREIWKFNHLISLSMPQNKSANQEVIALFTDLKNEIGHIKRKLK